MNLAHDISRCYGYRGAQICTDCERKAQIARDDRSAFFWLMAPAVDERGRCVYYIPPDAGRDAEL